MKAFIISQFFCSPLIWMFHSGNTENRVDKIYEKTLRLVYDDSPYLSFDELLIKNKSGSIYQRNLQFLATEIFKVKNEVPTGLTEDIFISLINPTIYEIIEYYLERETGQFFYGIESLSSLAPRIWVKGKTELSQFKTKIKTWTISQCPCRLCKKYIDRIGFT